MTERRDYYGNPTLHTLIAVPHEALLVRANRGSASARAHRRRCGAAPRMGGVRESLNALDGPRSSRPSFSTTRRTSRARMARPPTTSKSFAAVAAWSRRPVDLGRRIHKEFKFDPAATSVSTPLKEVLKQRRGVCQDFAHLMIGCLRSIGLRRALRERLPPHRAAARARAPRGRRASPGRRSGAARPNWVDIDPTNNCIVDDAHVTLAWGRDFGDVTPMRGVILGGQPSGLAVRVTVTPSVEAIESRR